MATARNTIKQWFSNFKKPTQEQFWAWIDSFWHKDDKIPMQNIEGLETALQGVPTSDQFSNHLTDSQAHQVLFNSKVDKEDGKGLISDAERTLIQENFNKRVISHSITGDVNKVSTMVLEDGSVIQAYFTDVAPAGPDVMLNSQNFNIETGVLTGVRSDGQQITANLNGRFALLGHTHTTDDVTGLVDALNEKADTNHTHSWNDLTDKPTISDGLPKTFPLGKKDSSHTLLIDNNLLEETNTFFLAGSDNMDKYINLAENIKNYSVISFMKCFNNGNVSFSHPNKMIVKLGADDFNGKKGSTAVLSIVDSNIFIQINNYE